jgi:TetR/AcrR family transcriptional regulator
MLNKYTVPLLTSWLNQLVIYMTTEDQILAAARKVFVEKGLAGARMQDIADEAGINKALLHYYFRSKDKLFEQIFQELATDFIPRINEIFNADVPLFDKIEMFCKAYIGRLMETPFIPLFVINEMNKQPDELINKLWGKSKPDLQVLIKQVETAIRKKEIRKIEPLQLLMHMVSLCIFPFLARPMMERLSGSSGKAFNNLMKERIEEVPRFIIDSLKT